MTTQPLALILGATGGIGGTVARTLAARGWRIRALARNPPTGGAYEWVRGDALNAADVLAAAAGASVIVHGVNPPGYRHWETVVLPMLDNTIAAARAVGARIILPGTVYNFGPDAFAHPITEATPQRPTTKKGAIRVEMERRLEASGLPVIIVRAGDYFGPGANSSWFSQGMIKAGKPVTKVTRLGSVGHQWSYLPDVAETMVRLLERADRLPRFAVYHMEGTFDADGTQLAAAIERVVGRPLRAGRFPWWIVPLAAPFVPFMREVREMRYLWREPLRMSNARLVAELGSEPRTPLDEAIRTTLVAAGCLPEPAGRLALTT